MIAKKMKRNMQAKKKKAKTLKIQWKEGSISMTLVLILITLWDKTLMTSIKKMPTLSSKNK